MIRTGRWLNEPIFAIHGAKIQNYQFIFALFCLPVQIPVHILDIFGKYPKRVFMYLKNQYLLLYFPKKSIVHAVTD
jgi:hypothetical protein